MHPQSLFATKRPEYRHHEWKWLKFGKNWCTGEIKFHRFSSEMISPVFHWCTSVKYRTLLTDYLDIFLTFEAYFNAGDRCHLRMPPKGTHTSRSVSAESPTSHSYSLRLFGHFLPFLSLPSLANDWVAPETISHFAPRKQQLLDGRQTDSLRAYAINERKVNQAPMMIMMMTQKWKSGPPDKQRQVQ